MRHSVSIFCTKWSDEECACTGGYWGRDHPESNMNPNGYNLSISISINDIWCFLYSPANVGYLFVFQIVHQDNTQWLILKAQELWPQHQQQVRDWQKPCGCWGHVKWLKKPSIIGYEQLVFAFISMYNICIYAYFYLPIICHWLMFSAVGFWHLKVWSVLKCELSMWMHDLIKEKQTVLFMMGSEL